METEAECVLCRNYIELFKPLVRLLVSEIKPTDIYLHQRQRKTPPNTQTSEATAKKRLAIYCRR